MRVRASKKESECVWLREKTLIEIKAPFMGQAANNFDVKLESIYFSKSPLGC